jgi:hypothetical protein
VTLAMYCAVRTGQPQKSKDVKKANPVTGPEGPQGSKMSRLPHFLVSRLTDGGEVVSLMRWPPFTPKKIPGTHFCYRLSRPRGHSAVGRIRSIEKNPLHWDSNP